MATLVREPGVVKVAEFPVPLKGTWNSIASNMLAPGAIYQSMNVFIRKGKLRNRPGYTILNETNFDNDIIGGDMAVSPSGKVLIAISPSTLYTLRVTDTVWQADFTRVFATDSNSIIDMCFIETSNQYVGIIANGETTLKYWIDQSDTDVIVASVGTVPVAKSVCIAARRVVALVAPHTLRWTSVFDHTAWSDLNFNKIAQTNDEGICIKPLGVLDFVLYKERSIYIARSQAGSDAAAFNVRLVQICEGPAGVHAVVDVDGAHIFMTPSGRIGYFDGSSLVNWICDGLWLYLQDDIDIQWTYKIFGVYDYRLHTVTFHYSRNNEPDEGAMNGLVIINLPLQNSGIGGYAPFLGLSQKSFSYGYEMRFANQISKSVVFSNEIGTSERNALICDPDSNNDQGIEYQCSFQTGLSPLPDMKHYAVSVESLFERGNGYGQVYLQGVKSDALEGDADILLNINTGIGPLDLINGQYISLSTNPVQEYCGLTLTGRFVGLKYSWQSGNTVRFGGAILYGRLIA